MNDKDVVDGIRRRFAVLGPVMDERVRRLWAGAEASAAGRGGVAAVARATGLAANTVRAGVRESAGGSAAAALPPVASAGPAAAASRWPRRTRRWPATWTPWSSRRPGATRGRRCGGRARAPAGWRRN